MCMLNVLGEAEAEEATVLNGMTWTLCLLVPVSGVVGESGSRRVGEESQGVAMEEVVAVVRVVGRKQTVSGTSGDQVGKGTVPLLVRTCKLQMIVMS